MNKIGRIKKDLFNAWKLLFFLLLLENKFLIKSMMRKNIKAHYKFVCFEKLIKRNLWFYVWHNEITSACWGKVSSILLSV
jgi:hypothetical protein